MDLAASLLKYLDTDTIWSVSSLIALLFFGINAQILIGDPASKSPTHLRWSDYRTFTGNLF